MSILRNPRKTIDYMKAYQCALRIVSVTARITTMRSAAIDSTRLHYARVPSGAYTCLFCVMCASRGFTYWDEETAGKFKPHLVRLANHADGLVMQQERRPAHRDPMQPKPIAETSSAAAPCRACTSAYRRVPNRP